MKSVYLDIFGFVGGGLLSINIIPQIYKSITKKSTDDLAWLSIGINIVGAILYAVYGFGIRSVPIIITIMIALVLNLILILVKCYFDIYLLQTVPSEISI